MAKRATVLTGGIWAYTALMAFLPSLVATGTIAEVLFLFYAADFTMAIFLSVILYLIAAAIQNKPMWFRIVNVGLVVIVVSAILAIVDAYLNGEFLRLLMPFNALPRGIIGMAFANFVGFSWLFGLLGAVYLILQSNESLRVQETELQEAKLTAKVAQLAALRLQLNPHFLFNTLNAISSLIVKDNRKDAEATVERLSHFLRSSLTSDVVNAVALEEELESLQNYLEIEAIRFGDRLTIEFSCPDDLRDSPVPSFILQPLVENSIKYAVSPCCHPITIRVDATSENDNLLITVSDNGSDAIVQQISQGTGIGLENVRRRLAVIYGHQASLETTKRPFGYEAKVRIPLNELPILEQVS